MRPAPTNEDVYKALEVLGAQQLHVTAEVRKANMPFDVKRVVTNGQVTALLKLVHRNHPSYWFCAKSKEGLAEKLKLIQDNIAAGKTECDHKDACCPLAEHRSCVCRASFDCPIHGVTCHGSHE